MTAGFCIVGASSISAFPLFSGFVSKSIVMAEASYQGHIGVWLMLLFASAGVFHHAGIKIPFFAFFSHDSGIRCKEAPHNMLVAMGIGALLCIGIGIYPYPLYDLLPYAMVFADDTPYVPYTVTHVVLQLQLLFFSALAFTFLKLSGLYPPELRSVNIDVDWSYRRLLPAVVRVIVRVGGPIRDGFIDFGKLLVAVFIAILRSFHSPSGLFGRTMLTGRGVLLALVLLAMYLLFYFGAD